MVLRAYRASGADLPFGDPRRAHGVAMEGYFWRVTTADGRVVVALCGIHRDADGRTWSNVALAAHPGRVLHARDLPGGEADPHRLGVRAGGGAFVADEHHVHVDLGPGAQLRLRLEDRRPWPRRRPLGGLGLGHLVPGLSQHWHPHLLGARAHGHAILGGARVELTGARVYAEKNWGRSGFPERWWWGQAHDFADGDVCLALAGGTVGLGPLRTTATALVVRMGDELVRLGDPVLSPVRTAFGSGRWELRARGPRWAVRVAGRADPAGAHLLPVPLPQHGHSVPGALQHLAGGVELEVRRRGRTVLRDASPLAGLEHGGRDVVLRHTGAGAARAADGPALPVAGGAGR